MPHPFLGGALLLSGIGVYLYFYHVRAMRYAEGKSQPMMAGDPVYFWVDLWIKVSTALVVGFALFIEHPALLIAMREPAFFWSGMAIAALGVGLFAWAMLSLDRQFSPCNDAYVPERVVREGPYQFIRHPIYTANMILMTGLLVAIGSFWLALNLVLLVVFYYRSAVREETSLTEHFPEYATYIDETGRFMPRLW
jgi:protein-S-isoprenylcysteine O-methyltransferase Ste14